MTLPEDLPTYSAPEVDALENTLYARYAAAESHDIALAAMRDIHALGRFICSKNVLSDEAEGESE